MLAHYVVRVTHQEGNLYWQVGQYPPICLA